MGNDLKVNMNEYSALRQTWSLIIRRGQAILKGELAPGESLLEYS